MYSIGIDLGGTNIAGAIVDSEGNMVYKKNIPTRRERPWEEIVEDMAEFVETLVKAYGLHMEEIQAVGVGCPGIIDPQQEGCICIESGL